MVDFEKKKHDKNEEKMSQIAMVVEVARNVHFMARTLYPWLKEIPSCWPKYQFPISQAMMTPIITHQ